MSEDGRPLGFSTTQGPAAWGWWARSSLARAPPPAVPGHSALSGLEIVTPMTSPAGRAASLVARFLAASDARAASAAGRRRPVGWLGRLPAGWRGRASVGWLACHTARASAALAPA